MLIFSPVRFLSNALDLKDNVICGCTPKPTNKLYQKNNYSQRYYLSVNGLYISNLFIND